MFLMKITRDISRYFYRSVMLLCMLCWVVPSLAIDPGKAYLFAYTMQKEGRNGLYMAWSTDQVNWHAIGPEHVFVYCDYGSWGSEKRMHDPFLYRGDDGLWHAVWGVNDRDGTFAYTSSTDLIHWKPQSYPVFNTDAVIKPEIQKIGQEYRISWQNADGHFAVRSSDFSDYTDPKPLEDVVDSRHTVVIDGVSYSGTIHKLPWSEIEKLIAAKDLSNYKTSLYSETTDQDKQRFAGLEGVSAKVKVHSDRKKKISEQLVGAFFEDINYAADGGIYAELIQNRDFEYHPSERKYRDPHWNALTAWTINSDRADFSIDSLNPIHANNAHYLVVRPKAEGATVGNAGFGGIVIKRGEKYDFSVFAKTYGSSNQLVISLKDSIGNTYGSTEIKVAEDSWNKYDAVIRAKEDAQQLFLEIQLLEGADIALDMVSLFPRKTFKGRKNGLRADLAQVIADIKPKFVRFPGGCVAHGDGLDNIYHWKNTVGPLEARKPQRNIWGYHQSMGLGYFEYFQFCEDIGAVPIPIIAAGVPCQNSSTGGAGQQCGLPMDEMDAYIQDILDLIEWANGPADSKWGSVRAKAGHPKPFGLNYIGIGNEDLISDVFIERFTMIYDAITQAHPEITVIGTVGPFSEGSDYEAGWELANELAIPMVDEHYYQPPGWFIHNQNYYDAYDRSKSKVYLGEYAAHLPGRPNNMETALSEALYLTSLERNGDIVEMTSYAPLLAKVGSTQWNPDLIYFDNNEVHLTPGYYVQKLFGNHSGSWYFDHSLVLSSSSGDVQKRVGVSSVLDVTTNELIVKLVNLLPVKVETELDLGDFNVAKEHTSVYSLGGDGDPDAESLTPQYKEIQFNAFDSLELQPYSLNVIRIKLL